MFKKAITILICFHFLFYPLFNTYADESSEIDATEFANQMDLFLIQNEKYESCEVLPADDEPEMIIDTNRIIVSSNTNEPLNNDYGAVSKLEGYNGIHILQYESDLESDYAYNAFLNQEDINYVEYDEIIELDELIENENNAEKPDSQFNTNYGLSYGATTVHSADAIGAIQDANLTERTVVVAVIDTGVDASHPFFQIDNEHSRILPSNRPKDNNPSNEISKYDHGTHVAGIIIDNTPLNVKIRSYNYFYYHNYTDSIVTSKTSLYSEIELAVYENVDVINLSLSGKGHSQFVESSIYNAIQNNIIVVSSAGNNNNSVSNYYPANIESLITVSATDSLDKPWINNESVGTNFGPGVDISAPGAVINSTIPGGSYTTKTGTSMSAPFVSASCAIIKCVDKSINCATASTIITSQANIPLEWNNTKYGAGIVDFYSMLEHSALRITAPRITVGSNGKYSITSNINNVKYYYTLDGSEPTRNSRLYTGEFSVNLNCKTIKAIAVVGPLTSKIARYNLVSYFNKDVYYKSTTELQIPKKAIMIYIESDNNNVISIPSGDKPIIYAEKVGKAKVTIHLDSGRTYIYKVTVKYSFWQNILRIFFFGFLWL